MGSEANLIKVESCYLCSGKPRRHRGGDKPGVPVSGLCVIFICKKKPFFFFGFLSFVLLKEQRLTSRS